MRRRARCGDVMAAGASAYLTKPLDLQKVLETLDYMLSAAAAGDSVPKGGGEGVHG